MSTERSEATHPLHALEADAVLRAIVQGTATETGHDFLPPWSATSPTSWGPTEPG